MYDPSDDATSSGRKAVMGALSLYLDFINLFMMLLHLAGNRRWINGCFESPAAALRPAGSS